MPITQPLPMMGTSQNG